MPASAAIVAFAAAFAAALSAFAVALSAFAAAFAAFAAAFAAVSYTHLRAHETGAYLVCRLLLEKKKRDTHEF